MEGTQQYKEKEQCDVEEKGKKRNGRRGGSKKKK